MSRNSRRLGTLVLSAALLIFVGLGIAGEASGKKKAKPLKVTCDQMYAEIGKTGEQLRAQFNAQGYTVEDAPEGFLVGGGCKKLGKRVRQGTGYMTDHHYADDGSPPFPGETNPDVFAYYWQWTEVVTRTKKGLLSDNITGIQCSKEALVGDSISGFHVETLAC